MNAELRDARDLMGGLIKLAAWCIAAGLVGWLSGCAPQRPAIKTETIEVPKYIKQPIDPELVTPIVVDKPAPACNDGKSAVYCNGQVAALLLEYQHVLDTCNADRKAIRDGQ